MGYPATLYRRKSIAAPFAVDRRRRRDKEEEGCHLKREKKEEKKNPKEIFSPCPHTWVTLCLLIPTSNSPSFLAFSFLEVGRPCLDLSHNNSLEPIYSSVAPDARQPLSPIVS
jgi:hypothetical protein